MSGSNVVYGGDKTELEFCFSKGKYRVGWMLRCYNPHTGITGREILFCSEHSSRAKAINKFLTTLWQAQPGTAFTLTAEWEKEDANG